MIKEKSGAVTPQTKGRWPSSRSAERGAVLALSRTLRAGCAGAAACAPASLTAAARGALPEGRSGRRDGRLRSNKGMMAVSSRGGGLAILVGGIEHVLLLEQSAGYRQQAVGNSAQGATVTVTTSAQLGIAVAAGLVVLSGHAGQ